MLFSYRGACGGDGGRPKTPGRIPGTRSAIRAARGKEAGRRFLSFDRQKAGEGEETRGKTTAA